MTTTTTTDKNNSDESEMNQGLTDLANDSTEETETRHSTWREMINVSIAKSRKIRGGNFVQIATVDPTTLEPRCRTVVFRGFMSDNNGNDGNNSKDPCIMKMITDVRSSKVEEVTSHTTSIASLLWWFSKSSEQYRIVGKVQFVGGTGQFELDSDPYYAQARKQQWGNLSDSAREQFYWRDPNTPYETQFKVPVGGRDDDGKVLPPPDNFLLMLMFPQKVDYLRLGDNYRQVDELLENEWIPKRVNP